MQKYKYNISGFTLVELIVAASILAILTTIGFYNYAENISGARDSVRQTDISALSSELRLYKRQRGAYPLPGNSFEIRNGTTAIAAYQGFMNNNVRLSTADSLPFDPDLETPYFYSVTRNRQEYQLAASMEGDGTPYAFLFGDYSSVSKGVLPTISLAVSSQSFIDISQTTNQELFIFNNGISNIPYSFDTGTPYSSGLNLVSLLENAGDNFWQNSDYRSCIEINTAGKNITLSGSTDIYQTIDSSGVLIDTTCNGIL